MTDTTTDQTRTEAAMEPTPTTGASRTTDRAATTDPAATTDLRGPGSSAPGVAGTDRTADQIVADRQAAQETGADAQPAALSTADIASGRTTPRDGTSPIAAGQATGRDVDGERVAPLFDEAATTDLRDRWTDVQAGFVDEPRSSVEQADGLVAEVMQRLADSFATERKALEQQWSRGDDVSTEDLRVALRRYRSFFDRLLSF